MSRETAVSTKYNQTKLVLIVSSIVISFFLIAVIVFLTTQLNKSEQEMRRLSSIPVKITPEPIKDLLLTPKVPTPTPVPTLTPDERQKLVDDMLERNPNTPQEVINAILTPQP